MYNHSSGPMRTLKKNIQSEQKEIYPAESTPFSFAFVETRIPSNFEMTNFFPSLFLDDGTGGVDQAD